MAWNLGLIGAAAARPLQYIATGLGSGYGSAVTSIDGNSYVQSYTTTYKLNKIGNVVWARQFSGTGNKQGIGIDSSENVYVSGNSSFVASLDSSGNVRWQREIGTGISWNSLSVDSSSGVIYVAGTNGSYGHIACINSSTGAVVWGRRSSSVNVEFTAVESDRSGSGRISASGSTSNGATLDGHFLELDTSGNIIFQRRLSLGTSNYVTPMSAAREPSTNGPVVSGTIDIVGSSFIIGFNTNGTTTFSIKNSSTGGYISSYFGTVGYDASGFLYLSFYDLSDNYTPSQKGSGYTRFLGTTPQKTVTFGGLTGTLRISTSKIDRTIGLMGVNAFTKVLGDDSVTTGTTGAYTVREDPEGLQYTSSGISISADGISYMNSGVGSFVSSFSVVPSSTTPTLTYLR